MLDTAQLLNQKLRANPMWRALAEAVEDLINNTVGAATDEAMNAIGNPYRYLRGDKVDPRTFPDIGGVDGGSTLIQMQADRDRVANVQVVLPADDSGNAQIYMEMDGQVYVATGGRFHSRQVLIQEAKLLGFDFFSDDLSDADYARVLLFISQYWPAAGSHESLANFLGFIRDIKIELVQLWTINDDSETYTTLERFNNHMTPVWDGGVYYPSFTYDMYYDAFADTDVEELRRLFFALAPIHLVLRRMVETIRSEAKPFAGGSSLVVGGKVALWAAQKDSIQEHTRYSFTVNNINMPLMLVAPNLEANGIAVSASGAGGVWILERDPVEVNPADPVQYMKDHGLYVAPTANPERRLDLPYFGIWNGGMWVMADTAGAGCLIEIT